MKRFVVPRIAHCGSGHAQVLGTTENSPPGGPWYWKRLKGRGAGGRRQEAEKRGIGEWGSGSRRIAA
jgi:hypothetical protein